MPKGPLFAATAMAAIVAAAGGIARAESVAPAAAAAAGMQDAAATATPIKHLVVLFNENVSFDHYFATYPKAANPPGEPASTARPGTPAMIDTLANANLLSNNPNFTNKANGGDAAEPFRLDRTQAFTADQNHAYTAEQQAMTAARWACFPNIPGRGRTAAPALLAPRARSWVITTATPSRRCGGMPSISR